MNRSEKILHKIDEQGLATSRMDIPVLKQSLGLVRLPENPCKIIRNSRDGRCYIKYPDKAPVEAPCDTKLK